MVFSYQSVLRYQVIGNIYLILYHRVFPEQNPG